MLNQPTSNEYIWLAEEPVSIEISLWKAYILQGSPPSGDMTSDLELCKHTGSQADQQDIRPTLRSSVKEMGG